MVVRARGIVILQRTGVIANGQYTQHRMVGYEKQTAGTLVALLAVPTRKVRI